MTTIWVLLLTLSSGDVTPFAAYIDEQTCKADVSQMTDRMKELHMTGECWPYSKGDRT